MGFEIPQTGDQIVQFVFSLPPLTPGAIEYFQKLAKWGASGGVTAIANARAVTFAQADVDTMRAAIEAAGGEIRDGWLDECILNAMRSLGAIALGANVEELAAGVDVALTKMQSAAARPPLALLSRHESPLTDPVDELRLALIDLRELWPRVDLEAVDAIEARIMKALELLGDIPLPGLEELEAESAAIGKPLEHPPLGTWPPVQMNFLAMADYALQERDDRELAGDGAEPAAEHIRNALTLMNSLLLENVADRVTLRAIGRRLVEALVAIAPRRA